TPPTGAWPVSIPGLQSDAHIHSWAGPTAPRSGTAAHRRDEPAGRGEPSGPARGGFGPALPEGPASGPSVSGTIVVAPRARPFHMPGHDLHALLVQDRDGTQSPGATPARPAAAADGTEPKRHYHRDVAAADIAGPSSSTGSAQISGLVGVQAMSPLSAAS